MPTDVIMPQMGESIFEGTITRWLKKPGERVERDEPLFEISTDKVDAEIPAPTAGVLKEIKVPEGTTVQVNTVVGVIDEAGTATTTAPQPAEKTAVSAEATPTQAAPSMPRPETREGGPASPTPREGSASAPRAGEEESEIPTYLRDRAGVEKEAKQQEAAAMRADTVIEFPGEEGAEGERIHSSPLVRRLARERQVDLHRVPGTGLGGRITKDDILRFIEQHPAGAPAAPEAPAVSRPAAEAPPAPSSRPAVAAQPPAAPAPAYQPGAVAAAISVTPAPAGPVVAPGEIVPMTPMRKKIAERMVESKRTSAHVHSVYEVDMTRVVKLRDRLKNDFERRTGSKLTFMPFFCRAAIHGIRQFPIINSSVEGDNIHYHRNINLGIAVALNWGLIVPVVKNAEEKNYLGLQRAITDLAERARSKKLLPDEVSGGTFTVTNPGNYGQMFGLPIIMQPQVAILGIGNIKKQPVVVSDESGLDSIAIRSICHLSLGYDHRVIDGAVADQFLREVCNYLQNWSEDLG